MEVIVLGQASSGGPLFAEWQRRADELGVPLHIVSCEEPEQASGALDQALLREYDQSGRGLPFPAEDGVHMLRPAQVRYLRGEGHRVLVSLSDGQLLRSKTLRVSAGSVIAPYLKYGRFFQASRVLYVNEAFISAITCGGITMTDGETLRLVQARYRDWRSANGRP